MPDNVGFMTTCRDLVIVSVLAAAFLAGCSAGPEAVETPEAPDPSATVDPESNPEDPQPELFLATFVTAGDQHACALDDDGAARCWGYNRMGQLGDGTATDSPFPVAVVGGHTFTALSAGRYFTCGLDPAGEAWCWGDNSSGQLGDGTTGAGSADQNRMEPVQVLGGLAFSALTTGQGHVCGLTEAGEAWCWGAYPTGQLGADVSADQTSPVKSADGHSFTALSAAGTNTCGLDDSRAVWCWGNNSFGQLGNGTTSNASQAVPVLVSSTVQFSVIAIARTHGCALDDAGAAWCWGANEGGQIGDGTSDPRLTPTAAAGGHTFRSLTGGIAHACAIDDADRAWCWGAGAAGQLGDGGGTDARSPVRVAGDLAFAALALGEEFTCGLALDRAVYCWGSNRAGWLGDGTLAGRAEPTPVVPAVVG